ncbi:MAG: fructosamine kinase family protein [Nitrosomonadales bacterium]|nr:fructosamine kinase family protein [Nitrosomonadales bacterium]
MVNWEAVAGSIGETTHTRFRIARVAPLGGGCINRAFRLEGTDGARYFVKLNDKHKLPMFEAEAAGLAAIAATRTVRVPQPVVCGLSGEHAFLVLEFLDLNGSGNARLLGEQLAALHRCTSTQFGFSQDNTIGETPQKNDWSPDWISFWRERRLGFQLDLAARNGYGGKLQEMGYRLMERLPEFLGSYQPHPSFLHGDLWGGNHAYTADGAPVAFDPAPYYGDREADLAMTELFGGFSPGFYAAYRAAWPLDAGYVVRKILYNLYHILNHANLFGGGYARQAEGMMGLLLKKPG